MIGLDNAGKTSIINALKLPICREDPVRPTTGISYMWLPFDRYCLFFRDLGGASNYRSMWSSYADDVNAIIFVIDSSDIVRMPVAADELASFLKLPAVAGSAAPLLVLANRNDCGGAAPIETIRQGLRLSDVGGRAVMMESVCTPFPEKIGMVTVRWLVTSVQR